MLYASARHRVAEDRSANASARDRDVRHLKAHPDGEGYVREVEVVRRGIAGELDAPHALVVFAVIKMRVPQRVRRVGQHPRRDDRAEAECNRARPRPARTRAARLTKARPLPRTSGKLLASDTSTHTTVRPRIDRSRATLRFGSVALEHDVEREYQKYERPRVPRGDEPKSRGSAFAATPRR